MLDRRDFLRDGGIAAAVSILAGGASEERPNILWVTCEDTSPDLGCYGDPYARTPNLDRLAGESVRFLNFPEYLRAAGYYCTNNSKTDYNFAAPLTAWDESSGKAHWRGRAKGQPFFAVRNITTTHEGRIRLPAGEFAEFTKALYPEDRHDPARAPLPPYYPDTPVVRRDIANYYDLVTLMDMEVGHILKELQDDGLAANTVVFFYGDHGRGLSRCKYWIYDSGIHIPLLVRWPGKLDPGTVNDRMVSGVDFGPTVLSIAGIRPPRHMQGRAFLGAHAAEPRQYVFAARDRIDETYDIIRCVRDRRFKYIRNYQPRKPYGQYMYDMDRMPTMQEMRRLNFEAWIRQEKLQGPMGLFFAPEKPKEELYDTASDPHEVRNLAVVPEYGDTLARFREVHERWMKDINDLGLVPEAELQERMRPGGTWAATAAPAIAPAGGSFRRPVAVKLTCATAGASIAYTAEDGRSARWKLYTGEITLNESARLRAIACRLGYRDSAEAAAEFRVD